MAPLSETSCKIRGAEPVTRWECPRLLPETSRTPRRVQSQLARVVHPPSTLLHPRIAAAIGRAAMLP
ncbi:MAG: hypothetical protein OJF62_000299 [Pseudolabrys sp.]|nr:hypothetical protein [Pseudolabrys sp.]